jgi:hypothetical protein
MTEQNSTKRQFKIPGLPPFFLSTRHIIEMLLSVGLFFLGPLMLCLHFSDPVWISVTVLGAVLFLDGGLELIGRGDKWGVFKDRKKMIPFLGLGLIGAGLFVVFYLFVLLFFFPPI